MAKPPSEMRERYAALLGEDRLSQKLGVLFGNNPKEMYRWEKDGWPVYSIVVLELLEELPYHKWPERIRLIREY